jgi:hypothetical protein
MGLSRATPLPEEKQTADGHQARRGSIVEGTTKAIHRVDDAVTKAAVKLHLAPDRPTTRSPAVEYTRQVHLGY